VLLAGAGVMIRSYLKIHSADMGVNTTGILGGAIDLPAATYPRPEDRISFHDRLAARLQATPGVESVATAETLPSWGSSKVPYELAGVPSPRDVRRPELSALTISPSYFRTLRASLLSGREFNDADVASGAPVAIVNQLFARTFWQGEDPVGKRLRFFEGNTPEPWVTVVGVASNIIQNDLNRQRFDPVVYLPYRQKPGGGAWILVRARDASSGLANVFRREVRALDPDLPLYGPMPIADRMERFWDSRFYGTLFLLFAAIALLLASIGLYTVVAHAVGQRTQEIGVRMALGAKARDILVLVCRQGLLPSGLGLAIGLAASLAVNRVLAAALVQVSPSDPISLIVAAAALVVSAMLGCLIPARRAMRVDPMVALRHE
jgi:putative ABC transport system permease protein